MGKAIIPSIELLAPASARRGQQLSQTSSFPDYCFGFITIIQCKVTHCLTPTPFFTDQFLKAVYSALTRSNQEACCARNAYSWSPPKLTEPMPLQEVQDFISWAQGPGWTWVLLLWMLSTLVTKWKPTQMCNECFSAPIKLLVSPTLAFSSTPTVRRLLQLTDGCHTGVDKQTQSVKPPLCKGAKHFPP